jgi:hypothetical protein
MHVLGLYSDREPHKIHHDVDEIIQFAIRQGESDHFYSRQETRDVKDMPQSQTTSGRAIIYSIEENLLGNWSPLYR